MNKCNKILSCWVILVQISITFHYKMRDNSKCYAYHIFHDMASWLKHFIFNFLTSWDLKASCQVSQIINKILSLLLKNFLQVPSYLHNEHNTPYGKVFILTWYIWREYSSYYRFSSILDNSTTAYWWAHSTLKYSMLLLLSCYSLITFQSLKVQFCYNTLLYLWHRNLIHEIFHES